MALSTAGAAKSVRHGGDHGHSGGRTTYNLGDFRVESVVRKVPGDHVSSVFRPNLAPGPLQIDGVRLAVPVGPKISPVDQF
jgi:hypothetical protein